MSQLVQDIIIKGLREQLAGNIKSLEILHDAIKTYGTPTAANYIVLAMENLQNAKVVLAFQAGEDVKAPQQPIRPLKPLNAPDNCAAQMRYDGKLSPRTCSRCGLGPCPFGVGAAMAAIDERMRPPPQAVTLGNPTGQINPAVAENFRSDTPPPIDPRNPPAPRPPIEPDPPAKPAEPRTGHDSAYRPAHLYGPPARHKDYGDE